MGGKKKKGGKGKGKKEDEEDLSVEHFLESLLERKLLNFNVIHLKSLKKSMSEFQEEGEPITKFHIWEELGWHGISSTNGCNEISQVITIL